MASDPGPKASIPIAGVPARWLDVPSLVRDKAVQHGDRLFCEIDGETLTYGELDRLSDAVAASLHRLGVRAGECVASVMFNCREQALGWIGTNKLGAIWAPLNASLGSDDLAHAIATTGARILIADLDTIDRIEALPAAQRAGLRVFLAGADENRPGTEPFGALIDGEAASPPVEIAPGDPAIILFTGGTTGLPKGVVLAQFGLIAAAYRYRDVLEPRAGDRHYTTLQMFHAGGVILGILGPLLNDIGSVLDRRFSASAYWERVRETGATLIDPIGTMMTVLTRAAPDPRDRDHRVRATFGVSGQIPEAVPKTFSDRFGIPIIDIYGLSEAGGALIVSNRPGSQVPGAVGRPHGWAEVAILDESDVAVAPGIVGEIGLRPTVPFSFMLGYHRDPDATLKAMRNQWLHTGDLGRLDEHGNLFFAGRQVHWIRRRGENVSAYEIEDVASRHAGIAESVAIGVPAELGEEDVLLCVIPADSTLDEMSIVTWCLERLAPFKVPRYVRLMDEFPRSATKREVERAKLKALGADGAFDRTTVMAEVSAQASGLRPMRSGGAA